MARHSTTQRLVAYFNARRTGLLEKETGGALSFAYDKDWLDWPDAIPVSISLPLSERVWRGAPVVNVFENLLPDAEPVRRNVAERLGAEGVDAFSLLSVAGRDCVGALQFLHEGMTPGKIAGEVKGERLTEAEIATLIKGLKLQPLGLDPEDEDFRISIAGAQDKTALLKKDGDWYRPVGTTATTHILKPTIGILPNDIDLTDSVQNEFVCLKLCRDLGLDVAEAEIEQFEDQLVLRVTRFDRIWRNKPKRLLRLPQEDFCQALSVPSTRKYQRDGGPSVLDILERLKESDRPNDDRWAFLRAQLVFWLIGATDGHAKNFSIRLRPGGRFVLAPLYDVLSMQPILDKKQISKKSFKLAMSLGENNRYQVETISYRHFEQTAALAGLNKDKLQSLCSELSNLVPVALKNLEGLIDDRISEELVTSLANGLRKRAAILAVG